MKDIAHKKLVQEYYARRARDYDRQKIRTWKSDRGFGDEVFSGLFDSLTRLRGKLVLEACVGTGRTSIPLLEKVRPWLIGLDLSREMLKIAEQKMSSYKKEFDFVLADAEHLPLKSGVFEAVVCTSAMHYFRQPERILAEFSRILYEKGLFVYGDLTLHESDDKGFLNRLERTVSHAHASYLKLSEVKKMLENTGFRVSETNVVPYRKPLNSLIEDKGRYFAVKPEALRECVQSASEDEKEPYSISDTELTLFYTLIKALKEDKP
jgi:ubiquinone/menaquinone biosynthesis C-methylase UbiE